MNLKIGKNTSPDAVYEIIHRWLENGKDQKMAECLLFANLARFQKAIGWELNEANLQLLWKCVNMPSEVDDDVWEEVRENFITEAFKDLSALRNPAAMELFAKLRSLCHVNDGELLLVASKTKKRTDGSAVLVIHVSDLEQFEKLLNKETGHGDLQNGLMIYS